MNPLISNILNNYGILVSREVIGLNINSAINDSVSRFYEQVRTCGGLFLCLLACIK